MKEMTSLSRISSYLNFVVIGLAIFAYLASGWNNPTVMATSFILMTLCFWASTILLMVDSVRSGSYKSKKTRASSIVRDLFSLIAALLLTLYTVANYLMA